MSFNSYTEKSVHSLGLAEKRCYDIGAYIGKLQRVCKNKERKRLIKDCI